MWMRGQAVMLGLALVAAAGPALAVEAIVVTAERREEPLQDVPMAVTAFDAGAIDRLQITTVEDIGRNVPNLQAYTATAGAQALQVHSRGASVQNPGFNGSEPPVGLYLDDVYYGRLASANLNLTDIERIEVLRGPQGTLYGRNTIAGAIKIISRTPGDDAWFNASAGYGNFDTWKIAASAGGPVRAGGLSASAAALYERRGNGWQDNPTTANEPGKYDNLVMRGKLRWYGTQGLDAVLTLWGASLQNDGYNGVPYDAPPDASGRETGGPLGGGFYDTLSASNDIAYGRTNQVGGSLDLRYDFGGSTLRSITAYSLIHDRFGFDLAGGGGATTFFGPGIETGNNGLLVSSDSGMNTFSEELHLLGNAFAGRLQWLTGLYFLNEDGSQDYGGHWTVADSDPRCGALPDDGDSDPDACFDFTEDLSTNTDSYAVFGEATWHVTGRLAATAGARWSADRKDYDNACTGTTCVPPDGAVSLHKSFDQTTWKLGLDFRLSDDTLAYVTYVNGAFQAGGFQSLCLGDLTAACAGTWYDPETVDSVDAGLKMELFDRTLRLNLAAFYAMYDDLQQAALVDDRFPVINVGKADVHGAELEFDWTPVAEVTMYGFVGWQASDYGTLNPAATAALSGAGELPSNPEFTGKIGFVYAMPVTDRLDFFYSADVYYSDDYYTTADNSLRIDSFTRVNGSLGIGPPDRRWEALLQARNIGSSDDNVSGIYVPGLTNVRTPLPPSQYMLSIRLRY